MADDTRQQPTREDLSREALTVDPTAKPFTATQWQNGKASPYKPPENANMMAGGTQNTAGGQVPDVTLWNAWNAVQRPITEWHKRPCVRDAVLTGIGAGFATGGVRAIFGAHVWKACSWAVGTFVFGSGLQHEWCMYKRHAEKEGMMRAVEILNRKEVDKRAREQKKEKLREERRAAKDVEQDQVLKKLNGRNEGGKSWWGLW